MCYDGKVLNFLSYWGNTDLVTRPFQKVRMFVEVDFLKVYTYV